MGELERMTEERLLTAKEVMSRTGLSRMTIYRYVKAGTFPPPRKLSAGAIRWHSGIIENWIRNGAGVSGA